MWVSLKEFKKKLSVVFLENVKKFVKIWNIVLTFTT